MNRLSLLLVAMLTSGLQAVAQDQEAQTRAVSGKVVDEHGKGVQGVTVSVKGARGSVLTDVNGDFMLDAPEDAHTLVVQGIGYATQYIEDEGQTLTVKLVSMSKMLDGNITTALGLRREKRDVGYTATTVHADDLNPGGNTSAITALQGKVAGANITSSTNGPGGSTRIVLRGEKSILRNNNALIVLDGVPVNNYDRTLSRLNPANAAFSELNQVDFGNSANDINPDDIESVTVLPAAAATALYGAMGSNGAVMYTTKKGKRNPAKNGKLDISYKMSYTQSDPSVIPATQDQYGQGNIYNGNPTDPREYRSWGYMMDGSVRPWGQVIDGKQLVKPYASQPNNIRNFYNHGQNLTNNVNISGGSDRSTYMLSLNTVNSTGVIPNTFYNRYGIRFNGSTELSHNLYTSINMNYINTYSRAEQGGLGSGSVVGNLLNTPRDIPVHELSDLGNKYYSMQYFDSSGGESYGFYNGSKTNPYWAAQSYDNRNRADRLIGDLKLGWKKNDWHVFDRLGVDAVSDRSTYKSPMYNAASYDPFYAGFNQSSLGGYTESNYGATRLYNDLIVNYNTDLNQNFGMNAFMGHNMTLQQDNMLAGIIAPQNGGLALPGYYNLNNNAGTVTGFNNRMDRRTVGVFFDAAFNYRRELFLEVSGRNDWSSTLATGRNSYFFPGANAGWVFTERLNGKKFKEKVLNYGKLRMAAGGAGGDGLAYANNNAGFTRGSIAGGNSFVTSPFNGMNMYQVSNTFGDNTLRPERTRDFETGLDLGFLRDKLNLSFTYYRSYTYNMIAPVLMPASSGYQYQFANIGDVSNNGVELAIKGTPISTRYGLKWELFGTLTVNRNRVENLNTSEENIVMGGYNGMAIVAAEGRPLGSFYANDIQYWKDAKGDWHAVVDQATGLPVATTTPVYKGSYQPKFMASWGTDVSYKGLKLHALFVTKQGGVYYSQTKMTMDENGTSEATTANGRNPYVWENSYYQVANTNIYLPNTTKFSPYEYYTNTQPNTLAAQGLVNASYVRLQELSLSYQIPQRYYQRSPFGGLEAGVYGNNLLLWTANSNKFDDPEATSAGATGNGQGFNYIARPNLRNYGVYVKVTF